MAQWTDIDAFVLDQIFGYQTANKIRENIEAVAGAGTRFFLGGSRNDAIPTSSAVQVAYDYVDVLLDGTNLTGLSKQVEFEVRVATSSAAATVTPQLWNVSDSTAAATGVSCAASSTDYAGTNQRQTVAATIATGLKRYRLRATPSDSVTACYVIGTLSIFSSSS